MIKKVTLYFTAFLMILIIAWSLIANFYKIDRIPYGYHVDELSDAVTVECLGTEGVDAHDNYHPLFGQLNYGTPKPATYMYPAVLWGKIFNFSIPSLRCFSVVGHALGIIGLFFLARLLFGNIFGAWVVFAAAVSPWVWAPSRVAFESLFAPTFFIWGLYFFFRRPDYFNWAIAGLLFSCAMYSYPPMRLQIPLMLMTLKVYSLKKIKPSLRVVGVFLTCWLLPLIPLVIKTINGEIQQRFNTITITSPDFLKSIHKTNTFKDLLDVFISNYQLHLSSDFLIFKGDPSLVHSTGHFGILSWLDMIALVLCLVSLLILIFKPLRMQSPWYKDSVFLTLVITNIFLGVVPSAITNSEIPNSLRIVGSWPFMCLLTGYFMYRLQTLWWPLGLAIAMVGVIYFISFTKIYFGPYQEESKGMFSFWTLEEANAAKSEQDWLDFMHKYYNQDYHFRYFLMQYRGESCTSSRLKWERQRDMLQALHLY